MKAKTFTLFLGILLMLNLSVKAQLNTGTGVPWGGLFPTEPLLLDENFQGFDFFHSDAEPNEGNSDNAFDEDGVSIIYGYKNDSIDVPIIGSKSGKVKYIFDQCAFAPEWASAYAHRDQGGQTANVSDGFLEISRVYGSTPPTVAGSFIVDLREIGFVEVIQWTHSSTGGNKRGVLCEYSIDNGTSWDTLRYQPAGGYFGYSFTKDIFSGVKTSNGYRCDPSSYGMTWEDGLWTDEPLMLRFAEAGGQTPRIHDLKVYGTYTPPTAVSDLRTNDFRIYSANRKIIISKQAERVDVYNLGGILVRNATNSSQISMDQFPEGMYIVKAQVGSQLKTKKIIIK